MHISVVFDSNNSFHFYIASISPQNIWIYFYFKMRFWNTISSLNNSNGKNPKWHSSIFLHKNTIVQHIVTSKALSCTLEENGKLHHTVEIELFPKYLCSRVWAQSQLIHFPVNCSGAHLANHRSPKLSSCIIKPKLSCAIPTSLGITGSQQPHGEFCCSEQICHSPRRKAQFLYHLDQLYLTWSSTQQWLFCQPQNLSG